MAAHGEATASVAFAIGSTCSAGVREPALFYGPENSHKVLHAVGRYVMLRHGDGQDVTFLISDDNNEALTACGISKDRSCLAVAEKRRVTPTRRLALFDLQSPPSSCSKPFKTFEPSGLPSASRVVGLAFSTDGQLLVAVSSAPEQAALVFDLRQEGRVAARCRLELPVDRVQVAPPQPTLPVGEQMAQLVVSVSGPRTMRLLQLRDLSSRVRESQLRVLPAFSGMVEVKITDHSWSEPADGTLIASIAAGTIFVLSSEDLAVVKKIETPFGRAKGRSSTHSLCLRCFSQGFVVGGDSGLLAIWEKVEAPAEAEEASEIVPKDFRHAGTVRVEASGQADNIVSLDLPGTEESLLIGCQQGSLAVVQIAALYSSKAETFECSALSGGFHGGPITGLEMAVQRPVIASLCKEDASIRVWNCVTRCSEIRCAFADDPPEAVALHPFGYFVGLAFKEKLRFFYILDTGLQLQSEWPLEGLQLVSFSNGGHLFAACQREQLHIFSTSPFAKLASLENSHGPKQGPITAMTFDSEDHCLWACSRDGTLCQWDTLTWARIGEHTCQGLQYLAATSPSSGTVCCSAAKGSEWCLQHFTGCVLEKETTAAGPSLHSLCSFPGNDTILTGSSTGTLKICIPPSAEKPQQPREHVLHAGACSFLRLSADGKTLATGGEDGAIFLLNVAGLAREAGNESNGDLERRAGADRVLVNRAAILKRQGDCEKLRADVEALKLRLVVEAQLLEESCRRRAEEARAKDRAEITELSRRCAALEQAALTKDRESKRIMKSMEETHSETYHQLSQLFDSKLEYEEKRYEALEQRKAELLLEIERTTEQSGRQLQKEEEEFANELTNVMAEKDFEIQKHKDIIAFSQHRFDKILETSAEEHDEEVIKMKLEARAALEEQKQIEEQLRKEQTTLQRGHDILTAEKATLEKEQQESGVVIRSIKEQIEEYKHSLASLKAEKKEREGTLQDKGQKIESYKVKVKELKKFKHLLDQQLAEVTASLQPKQELMQQLQRTLQELQKEYEVQHADAQLIAAEVKQREVSLAGAGRELQELQEAIKVKEKFISHYSNDLHFLVTQQADESVWPREIRRLYHTHVCGILPSEDRTQVDKVQLQMRQMERTVTGLASKSKQQKSMCKTDIQKKANENAMLVHEVNQLRIHKRSLQTAIKNCTIKLDEYLTAEVAAQAPRSALEDGKAKLDETPLPLSSSSSLPRTPSGSFPGPRQQSSLDMTLEQPVRAMHLARTRSVPPLSAGRKRQIPLNPEDQTRLQSHVATAAANARHLQAQKVECATLRSQIDILLEEKQQAGRQHSRRSAGTEGRALAT